jgi:thioredoxin-like negative regulator of GroEL
MSCELADKIVESKVKLNEFLALPEVSERIASAEKRFASCIENIVEGDNQSIVLDCLAGLLDLQLAERAFKDVDSQPDRRQNQESRQAILEFKQEVQRVLKLVEKLDIDDKSLNKRLEAALQYFIDGQRKVNRNELDEAERLGREAHLELDFSWQLANAIKKAEYREKL